MLNPSISKFNCLDLITFRQRNQNSKSFFNHFQLILKSKDQKCDWILISNKIVFFCFELRNWLASNRDSKLNCTFVIKNVCNASVLITFLPSTVCCCESLLNINFYVFPLLSMTHLPIMCVYTRQKRVCVCMSKRVCVSDRERDVFQSINALRF